MITREHDPREKEIAQLREQITAWKTVSLIELGILILIFVTLVFC